MTQVAEGIKSGAAVLDLASKHGVEMPITQGVYSVCHEGMKVADVIAALMGRSKKAE